ncbi:MAG: sigma-70 family RNA polymerase sigma factor [Bacteroidota bacterium]
MKLLPGHLPDPKKNHYSDEELVQLILDTGKSHYFEQIYSRFYKKVFYQVLPYVKDDEVAQDLTQDIFVKLFDRLAKFTGKSSFSTWLFSFSRNACLDYLRRQGKLKETRADESTLEAIPEVGDDELLQIRSDRLAGIMDQVSQDEKAILIMMYAYEWKMDEIAEKMGISLSAVKMRIKRAKAKVKDLYEEKYGSG